MKKIFKAVTGTVETTCDVVNDALSIAKVLSSVGNTYASTLAKEAIVDASIAELDMEYDLAKAGTMHKLRMTELTT